MITVPNYPLDAECKKVVDFCLHLLTTDGFMELYKHNLVEYKKPGIAYEATEQTAIQLLGQRRYKDRETFYNALSRYNKNQ